MKKVCTHPLRGRRVFELPDHGVCTPFLHCCFTDKNPYCSGRNANLRPISHVASSGACADLPEDLIRRNTMHTYLENAPSKTGNPSGPGRGNNPPRGK